jgi:hypothetical protein
MSKALAVFLLAASCLFAQNANSIIGRWRSVETSKGGIGAMYEFAADGTVQFSPGAIVPSTFQLEGNRLSLDSGERTLYEVAWAGDNRLRMGLSGATEEYARLGARRDPQNPLIGEWIGTRDMNGTLVRTHWIFQADASALLMIRFKTENGTYSIRNGMLAAKFAGGGALAGTISIADGVLSITRAGGRVTKLARY